LLTWLVFRGVLVCGVGGAVGVIPLILHLSFKMGVWFVRSRKDGEMTEASIDSYITTAFEGIETQTVSGDTFYFYRSERMMPMVTLVTSDANDTASDLNRPGVFRLNIGVRRGTFESLFGPCRLRS
jgi:hypothetical protein